MDLGIAGRRAAVAGASAGLGLATARALAAEGVRVVIGSRSADKLAAAAASIDGDVTAVVGDVATPEGATAWARAAADALGGIDIVVPNAGGGTDYAPVAQLTDEAMAFGLTYNFWHTFWTMRAALNAMIPAGFGRISAMSSVEGKVGKPALSPYVVGKHAINGLVKSAAKEVGTLGITVNALCPGAIETDIMKAEGPGAAAAMGLTYEGLLDVFAQDSAIKRLNDVEEVAAVAVLLASDAGAGITGSMISIDGGTSPY